MKRIRSAAISVNQGLALLLILLLVVTLILPLSGCEKKDQDTIVLRISNWEEYVDEGGWSSEEAIVLADGTVIQPQESMLRGFENWYYEKYGQKVRVEYSTFGTNEELYNQMTLGDVYDLVCPSEYMIMRLMAEQMLEPFSKEFMDIDDKDNYYINGVSPYINDIFHALTINDQRISDYAAGYMWGTLGIVYNPKEVTQEEASHWNILNNSKFYKQITIKDSVRDAYFAGISILNQQRLLSEAFTGLTDYESQLSTILNDTSKATVDVVGEILSAIKDNVYSFETDSGKADMATGKVVANMQWSGDAVYTLNEAEEEGVSLCYSAPEEAVNLWFDGWCMLKNGIDGNKNKQHAAESFINYISIPENAIRNMSYIGYTSVIARGSNDQILQYIDYCYGADEADAKEAGEDLTEYSLDYFFEGMDETEESDFKIFTTMSQTKRQLFAQYPTREVIHRSVVMDYFQPEGNERINQMWTDVRCFDLRKLW